ncbi:MAG: HU family DNA-binding protein [Alloprevotella sp.]
MERKILLQEISDILARRENITKKKAEAFVRTFFEVVEQGLASDQFVKVKGFGTFKLVAVGERESINVNTGERIQIGGHTKISFLPDANFKNLVNRPFAHFETIVLPDDADLDKLSEIDEEMATQLPEHAEEDNTESEDAATAAEEAAEESELPSEPAAQPETPKAPDETTAEPAENISAPDETPADEAEPLTAPDETPADKAEPFTAPDETEIQQDDTPEEAAGTETQQPATGDTKVVIVPAPPTPFNWWKAIVIFLAILVLMVASYFAGYFRLFCPCEFEEWFRPQSALVAPQQKQPTPRKARPAHTAGRAPKPAVRTAPQQAPKDSVQAQPAKAEAQPAAPARPSDDALRKQAAQYPQVQGGKYLIVGTRKIYKLRRGDDLYHLAKDEYGHKDFARYIIAYNHFENPDNLGYDTPVKLPELTERR